MLFRPRALGELPEYPARRRSGLRVRYQRHHQKLGAASLKDGRQYHLKDGRKIVAHPRREGISEG